MFRLTWAINLPVRMGTNKNNPAGSPPGCFYLIIENDNHFILIAAKVLFM